MSAGLTCDFAVTFKPMVRWFFENKMIKFYNLIKLQAPVVLKLDSAIHLINLYPVDNAIGFPNTYPLDSDL